MRAIRLSLARHAVFGLPALLLNPAVLHAAEGELDEVVVTASRSERNLMEVPASVSSQSMDELRDHGFTYGSEEFRGIPGVFARRGEGDGDEFLFVSIRGSSGTEGYVALIDGVPFLGPDEEPLLNQVPYDALERVEVVKGPVSALYGRGGLHGAVNYITRLPSSSGASFALTAGEDDYYRGEARLEGAVGSGRALLSAAYEDYGGWREQGGKQVLNLFGRAEFELTARTTLDVSANYFDRDSEVPNAVPTTPDGEVLPVVGGARRFLGYGDPRNRVEGIIGSARVTHAISDALAVSLVAQARHYDQTLGLNFYDPFGLDLDNNLVGFNGYTSDITQNVYFTEGTVSYQQGAHTLVAGVSGERSTSRSIDYWSGVNGFTAECGFNFYLIQFDYTTGENVSADHPCFVVDEPLTRDRFTNTFWGAFLQDEIQLGDHWRLTVGGRYDSFERRARVASPADGPFSRLSGKASAFSPKAAISWLYGGGQLYLSYGRGFNSNFGTTFEWDAAQYARPENRPSTLDAYELGWKGKALDDRLQFETAVFFTEQTNRRQFVPNPDAEVDPTAPGSRIAFGSLYRSRGFEASLRMKPWSGGSLTLQYSYLDPEWKDYLIQSAFSPPVDLSGTTPTGVARNIYYFAAEQQFLPWLKGQATLQVFDDYQITQLNNLQGGGYILLDLGATIAPQSWRNLSLNLSLANALDERYYHRFGGRSDATVATPGVPRQLRATVRASF
jgi:outer membrane receptor protein involved in Fe transport